MEVIVHGGAGTVPKSPAQRGAALERVATVATNEVSPVDAVRQAIRILEDDPLFNAGVGSAVQSDGRIRTDAGIMTGDGRIGAACAMPDVQHAIDVAEGVRTETPHVLLAGPEAAQFASALDLETGADLWTEQTRDRWAEAEMAGLSSIEQCEAVGERFGRGHDTVGAVATDGDRIVAGTSTGGRWFALAGRVGDVPQVGCGFHAVPAGAASTTGAGEDIARVMLAREATQRLESGMGPSGAAEAAMDVFAAHTAGTAGLIVMTPAGEVGIAFSSEAMQTCAAADGKITRSPQTQYL